MTVRRVLHYPDGTVDEVVGEGYYHLEQMDEHLYWMGLVGRGGEQLALWIAASTPVRVTGGINGEESGTWPEGIEVEHHATGPSGSPDSTDQLPLELLALLCQEIDSSVPIEQFTPRATQLLRQAEEVCAHRCGYDSWEALAEAMHRGDAVIDNALGSSYDDSAGPPPEVS